MEQDPTARALALLALLAAGGAWTARDLADRLGVTERTARRDVQRLRRLGYSVAARPGPGSAYRLAADVRLPPLLLTDDEVSALVAGLRLVHARLPDDGVAASALRKLEQVLPRRAHQRASATDRVTEVLEPADPRDAVVSVATVGLIADAAAEDGRLRFTYTDRHGTTATRTVQPYRHVFRQGRCYLVAFDVDRDGWRTFRLDRIREPVRVAGTFSPRTFPWPSVEHWLSTDFGRLLDPP